MKDLDLLRYSLGIEVVYSSRAIFSQSRSIFLAFWSVLLFEILLFLIRHLYLLLWSWTWSFVGDPLPKSTRYRELLVAHTNLSATQPDISNVVHVLCQFVSTFTSTHHAALVYFTIFCGTMTRSLLFPSDWLFFVYFTIVMEPWLDLYSSFQILL